MAQAGAVEDRPGARQGSAPGWVSAGCRSGDEAAERPAPQAPGTRGDSVKRVLFSENGLRGPTITQSTYKQARNLSYKEANTPVSPPCTG